MSSMFRLKRTRQCGKCPWKKSTNPHDIPDGYSVEKHRALACTIAQPGELGLGSARHVMSCHEHSTEEGAYCVGWLVQQLGPGNNISLRLSMRDCENIREVRLDGPQHERFEETLPADCTSEHFA